MPHNDGPPPSDPGMRSAEGLHERFFLMLRVGSFFFGDHVETLKFVCFHIQTLSMGEWWICLEKSIGRWNWFELYFLWVYQIEDEYYGNCLLSSTGPYILSGRYLLGCPPCFVVVGQMDFGRKEYKGRLTSFSLCLSNIYPEKIPAVCEAGIDGHSRF